ncbi:trimeric intracellular cation channel family protein [Enterovibrio sp. ZSDZ42]|uniref:Trimeric intracellular cation channel family protein n=1 Tax=Enterovibrio gelatinilyticus TaxID=2899819 RepID=A0ABT5QWL7_9GAMM|nr:trimeric intracellular cation channel family protein [Enterovibrio sp. ZSDZ42]MDD1792408.1 trimeric intracellular cation channel family protein [Enterovibrio sp. ZSDZ42]
MLLSTLYIIGITAEAMTGALAAGKRNMDWFGVMLVASCTAIGGGTVRDILLGHYPLGWVANPHYLIIVCVAGIVTTWMASWVARNHKLFVWLDSLGLIAFSIIGCRVGIDMGLSPLIAVVSAVVTGVFGGLLRDLLCRRQPMVLHKELYASIAFFSGWMYWALLTYGEQFGVNENYATLSTLILGFTFRMCAVKFGWRLPVFSFESEEQNLLGKEGPRS